MKGQAARAEATALRFALRSVDKDKMLVKRDPCLRAGFCLGKHCGENLMVRLGPLLLIFLLWHSPTAHPSSGFAQASPPKIETTYDRSKDKTTVRLAPVQISGAKDKYHSLHMSPSFSYSGREPRAPEIVDFELQTVVKGKLRIDLYVLFVVDGEKIFLSSNRWGVKKGNLGRGWMGEHLVFRMPYETFQKIIKADGVEVSLDGLSFPVEEEQLELLRELDKEVTPTPRNDACTCIKPPAGENTHWSNGQVTMKDDRIYKSLHGIFQYSKGSPIPEVLVEIYDKPESVLRSWRKKPLRQRRIAACKTGADGKFCFLNIPPGRYELRGSKAAETSGPWNPVRAYVILDPRKKTSINAGLELDFNLSH